MLLKFLPVLAGLALIVGVLRVFYVFRSRAMRDLAARWGFQYVGPPAPNWRSPIHPTICHPVPGWFSEVYISGRQIRQVFNVIEGQQSGVSILIFDSVVGRRGGTACTLMACQTEGSPFGMVISPDRVIHSRGWTILHGIWFLYLFSWTMGIRRLDSHLKKLQIVPRA